MDTYEYDELPLGTFRYLVLFPGVDHDSLRCSLHTTRIDDAQYESVSYVWGTDYRDHDIICDGRVLKITANLHRVLQQVRYPDAPRTLWADSICINQEDLQEKSRQVTLMGHIYCNAERVLVCMGPSGDDHGPSVVSLLQDVCGELDSTLHRIRERVDDMRRKGEWEPRWSPWDSFPHTDANSPILSDPRWASVSVLAEQDWFSRGWVVREAGLSRQGLVIWGNTKFAWHDLMRVLVWRHRRAFKSISIPGEDRFRSHLEAYETQAQDIICTFYQEGAWKACSLLGYMHCARALQLKDPRDRIYAFLDLAKDSTRQLCITPNYNDAPSKVYHDFARDYVSATRDVDLLYYVKHNEQSLKSPSMTWAPDWNMTEDNFIGFLSTSDNYPPLRSRKGRVSEPELLEGTTLQVQGVIWDSVHFVSDVMESSTTTAAVLFELWTLVRQSRSEWHYPISGLLGAFFDVLSMASYYGSLEEWLRARTAYITAFEHLPSDMSESIKVACNAEEFAIPESSEFHGVISSMPAGKRFIVTKRGCFGLAPDVTRAGDSCGIIFGCSSPCLLREASYEDRFVYLGPGFFLGRKPLDLGEHGVGFYSCLGVEESKDWVQWDVKEQHIYLC